MKRCFDCGKEKPSSEFAKNRAKKDGLQGQCKVCKRERDKLHYQANRQWYYDRNERVRQELLEWYIALKDRPCVDCGQKFHYSAMDWDHIAHKDEGISALLRRRVGKERILAEIAKCELVCSNCHRYRTWKRNNAESSNRQDAIL